MINNKCVASELLNVWISPVGEVFHVEVMGHVNFVNDWLKENTTKDKCQTRYEDFKKSTHSEDITDTLYNQGWVKIMQWRIHLEPILVTKKRRLSGTIKKAIVSVYTEYGYPVPNLEGE